ncbi:tripartite motif-containing protein 3 [Lingula anatina]|uniref:Tripartite motif-containing protein 3 n=1 Tax=Lingula anatina TaxID=7574 RepID=A0A1S3JTJ9_LINAN|nr:tripartite motif-containing protein 3 [Lingula anatina]XP_013413648.1 tripartite motif-containing protein 3 [Lingula anatina]|eukprot:XP_013413647.1 tripartite motif-containing protein 3 [Lingula anatina]
MSDHVLANQISADHLTCSICLGRYCQPKALPCLHTFCLQCLQDHITATGRSGVFECPNCRKQTIAIRGGASCFPDNHIINSLQHTVGGSTSPEPSAPPSEEVDEEDNVGSPVRTPPGSADVPVIQWPPPPPRPPQAPVPSVPSPTHSSNHPTSTPTPPPPPPPPRPAHPPLAPTTPRPANSPHTPTNTTPQRAPPTPPAVPQRTTSPGSQGRLCTGYRLLRPTGVTILNTGDIVVSDSGDNKIVTFAHGGQYRSHFQCDCEVKDIATMPDDTLIVAVNKAGSAIARVYSHDGRVLKDFGNQYYYEEPHGITVSHQTDQFIVTNVVRSCIYLFNMAGKLAQQFGSKGHSTTGFSPYYCAINGKGNKIHVSNTDAHNVKVFDTLGNLKHMFGEEGNKPGQLKSPQGICLDNRDNIIVADSGNYRIQQFDHQGKFKKVLIRDTRQQDGGLNGKPCGLALSPRLNILAVTMQGPSQGGVILYPYRGNSGKVNPVTGSPQSGACNVS